MLVTPLAIRVEILMQGSRALSGVFLLLVLALLLVNTMPAWALTITPLTITGGPTAGFLLTISGNSDSSTITLSLYKGSSCQGLLVFSIGESGPGAYSFTVHMSQAGPYSAIVTGDAAGCVDFSVADAAVVGPVTALPYSACVISLGVEQSDGTVLWLPGYTYPGTPISQCQDKTEVLGQDAQGRTILMHQYILNGTSTG